MVSFLRLVYSPSSLPKQSPIPKQPENVSQWCRACDRKTTGRSLVGTDSVQLSDFEFHPALT